MSYRFPWLHLKSSTVPSFRPQSWRHVGDGVLHPHGANRRAIRKVIAGDERPVHNEPGWPTSSSATRVTMNRKLGNSRRRVVAAGGRALDDEAVDGRWTSERASVASDADETIGEERGPLQRRRLAGDEVARIERQRRCRRPRRRPSTSNGYVAGSCAASRRARRESRAGCRRPSARSRRRRASRRRATARCGIWIFSR